MGLHRGDYARCSGSYGKSVFLKMGQGTIPRLGDLINDAKTTIPGGMDVKLSWVLFGDPMLKVRLLESGDRAQQ